MLGSGLHDIFHSTAFAVARNVTLFVLVVFWLGLAYWAFRDARRRIDYQWLVAIASLVALVPVFGPLVYLLFRPPETLAEVRAREIEVRALKAHLDTPATLQVAVTCPGLTELGPWQSNPASPPPEFDPRTGRLAWSVALPAGEDIVWSWTWG